MNARELLSGIGLTDKESEIYIALASLRNASANEVAATTTTNRTVTYNILSNLVDKGLVSHVKQANHRTYRLAPPERLLDSIEEKKKLAMRAIEKVKKITPKDLIENEVETFEGRRALRQVWKELPESGEVLVMNVTGALYDAIPHGATRMIEDLKDRCALRVICTPSAKHSELMKHELNWRFVDSDNKATTFIYKNVVLIHVIDEPPVLIRITDLRIAEGYRQIFETMWKSLSAKALNSDT